MKKQSKGKRSAAANNSEPTELDIKKATVKRQIKELKKHSKITLKPRNEKQSNLIDLVKKNTFTFALGAAGSGKTHVAVTLGFQQLIDGKYHRMVIVRPAVEAGEKLGHLPGDINEKMGPYVRPIYDIIGEFADKLMIDQLILEGKIEIVPLAYMRGRTFKNSYIVFDEAQNADEEQMLMALTRLGEKSKMVICGDPSQNDLKHKKPGIVKASDLFADADGFGVQRFNESDCVRHPLVTLIMEKYIPGK